MKNILIPILIVILCILPFVIGPDAVKWIPLVDWTQLQLYLACIYFYRKLQALERRIGLINKKATRAIVSKPKSERLTEIFEEHE